VTPAYVGDNSGGLYCTTCFLAQSRSSKFYTSDPKLGDMTSTFLEIALLAHMSVLHKLSWLPGHDWLGAGIIQISYGHYINSGDAHVVFGDSEVAGLTLEWPL
jgi:hypothetical protein